MNIAILGYGKMGRIIEEIAISRGHKVVIKAIANTEYDINQADVAIEFSVPTAAVNNISTCLNNNVPVVSGTTGWLDQIDTVKSLCNTTHGAFLYASNFSLGVNIFFELNKHLAKMMSNFKQYNIAIEEIHHTQKLDKPSGTAITLAEHILEKNPNLNNWNLDSEKENAIPIYSKRFPEVPGTHEITYKSEKDTLSIKHEAHTRHGFALGAVIAAEWILNKKGVFSMKDVLNIG